MFGADTPLVMDALQMAGLALVAGGAGMFFILRRRKADQRDTGSGEANPDQLEERVRVLERIATDQSIGLADEIEALRSAPQQQDRLENASQ